MIVFQLLLFVLFALALSNMFSGFMLARRMGMYLMMQVMVLMLAMLLGLVSLVVGFLSAPTGAVFELQHLLLIGVFVLTLLGTLMEFGQVLPILLKTMQGGPFHNSHIATLLVTLFLSLAMVVLYGGLVTTVP